MSARDSVQVKLVALRFVNIDATPKTVELLVSQDSVPPIVAWYGSHNAGDRYSVYLDGEKVRQDQSGELQA